MGCTTGQYVGGGMVVVGGGMMVGGFTTETSCHPDHPCYREGDARPITSGEETTRPRSVPVGVIGAALVVSGAIVFIASTPHPKPPPRPASPAPEPE
jgi:hypothetical protein